MSSQSKTVTIQSFLRLQCLKADITSDEIMALIPADTLAKIKADDPHPFFQAYSICHEGISNPTILGDTAKPIHWFKAAIQSIKGAVLKGINFFMGHNADNSTENRESLGEVVADFQREMNGELHHIVVGYFPDKTKVTDLDICSQEAEWNLIDTGASWVADKLEKLTGIALASSKYDKPAFAGAKRLGMVQAFEAPAEPGVKEMNKMSDLSAIPFNDLAGELKRRNTWPSQIWSFDEMMKLDKEYASEAAKLQGELTDLKTKLDAEVKKNETLQTEMNDSKKKASMATAKTRLEDQFKEQNLTEEQASFVLKRFSKRDLEDTSDEGLKRFITEQLTLRQDVLGEKDHEDGIKPPKASSSGTTDTQDYTKAENNPLLFEDLEV